MRIIALDYGERRIGVAAGDDRTRVAVPLGALDAGGDAVAAVQRLLADSPAEKIIVGLPVSLSGQLGPQARQVQAFVQELARRTGLPVETRDERYSTVEAQRRLGPGHKRERRDALAAAIVLQDYFDSASADGEAR